MRFTDRELINLGHINLLLHKELTKPQVWEDIRVFREFKESRVVSRAEQVNWGAQATNSRAELAKLVAAHKDQHFNRATHTRSHDCLLVQDHDLLNFIF